MATITFQGKPVETIGKLPAVGTLAPDCTVTRTDLGEINLHHYLGHQIILNIFPSLDTQTCAEAMAHFNDIAREHPNLLILCISADLPFAQQRFCAAKHVENIQPVSVFRHDDFGKTYGVSITQGPLCGLLSRAVVIIDQAGKIVYTEQVAELMNHPDYAAIKNIIEETSN